jgi:hypothetical protein
MHIKIVTWTLPTQIVKNVHVKLEQKRKITYTILIKTTASSSTSTQLRHRKQN